MSGIRKVLVANRGEIASRIMRTCRAMGITTVAVYSEPDADAPFVSEADEAVPLGGSTAAESYLRIEALVDACKRTGADAIHPGYGFLSENAALPRACIQAGLIFVGPSASAIESMGSKLNAKATLLAEGVPVLAGVEVTDLTGASLAAAAEGIGWPILVKADYGGGGRGMRLARSPTELHEAAAAGRREAAAAFVNGAVFLESYIEGARHVEVQVFGDRFGTVVHLFERECSIQRRHQKVLEESPSPAVDDALRAEMGAVAVSAAKAIGYEGAGTVEFLLTPEGRFFFLEMNTRLQVEHAVTECVTGLDLVRLQLLVAEGLPLPPEALDARMDGHAIEARLYAEDPGRDFLPVSGRFDRFRFRAAEGIRVDSGVADGSEVSVHYDSMLAKVIAHAPTRSEAARRLEGALTSAKLHGPVTNRDLLVGLLRHEDFVRGAIDTQFLERNVDACLAAGVGGIEVNRFHALAAALAGQADRRSTAPVQATLPSGWRNNPSGLRRVAFRSQKGVTDVGYRLGNPKARFEVDGEPLDELELVRVIPEEVVMVVAGVRRRYEVAHHGSNVDVDSSLGHRRFQHESRFPSRETAVQTGSLLAPMPGTVVRLAVMAGDSVAAGQVLVVIEAMKMEHEVAASESGSVRELNVEVGQNVDTGAVLVVVEADGREGDGVAEGREGDAVAEGREGGVVAEGRGEENEADG